uniref:LAGLIDADG endonuclease n=1 Tax=Cryphonectria parasitica TaxID=5116 RepID=A0A191MXA9_CRYPA|nr:LAGLIDADG endonuclease [Cryphonectria parasitica]
MIEQKHRTIEGLAKIVNIKAAMNFGVLSENLLSKFINVGYAPVERPLVRNVEIYDSNWVSGFVEGEGCFFVNIYKRKDSVLGEGVKLVFKITQDKRNNEILALFSNIFGCGKVYNQSSKGGVQDFMITGLGDITEKVIPFFLAHPLKGAKLKEYQDWCKVAKLMQNKEHLTKDGLEKIRSRAPCARIPPCGWIY